MLRRARAWAQQTHGSFFELLRYFLAGQFSNSVLSSDRTRLLAITSAGILGAIGPLIVRLYMPKYDYLRSLTTGNLYASALRADHLFFVTLSMIITTIAAAILWDGIFPERRDYLILKPLPVPLYQVFCARLFSVFLIVAFVITDLNGLTSMLFTAITRNSWGTPGFLLHVCAHFIACAGAGLFAFLFVLALQGACLNLLPASWFERMSTVFQAVFLTAFVALLPYVFDIPNWFAVLDSQPSWLQNSPPAWFWGLQEKLFGSHDPFFLALAHKAVRALEFELAISAILFFSTYRRFAKRALEQSSPRSSRRWMVRGFESIAQRIVRDGSQLAIISFVFKTVTRVRRHRMLLMTAAGIAAVFAMESALPAIFSHLMRHAVIDRVTAGAVLAVPLIFGGLFVSALCLKFEWPVDLPANWPLRMMPSATGTQMLRALFPTLVLFGILPGIVLGFPIAVLALGLPVAVAHSVLAAVLLLAFTEMKLRGWEKIPFTCSYTPGRKNIWVLLLGYLAIFAIAVPAATYSESALLSFMRFLLLAAFALLVWLYLRLKRLAQAGATRPIFVEPDDLPLSAIRMQE